ncbi:ODV-E27 [Diatraea saccharalis granulovirus]|uniref:ODV-E27 n=1 Tax=Diatraea saccharalis granulovirus TaxID=1675862 RepID=A0A0R7EYT5_9BBAC|nr:ODV-E27 [Diatraea saccharalis granulovirus]AKN80744.1 ODV-E27 [Diatraea saccharalis granulovirus]
MNRYRTVTEIVDSEDLYQKEFDVSDLIYQNEAYLRKMNRRELYLMVSKYIASLKQLDLTDLNILFANKGNILKVFTLVYHSLAFVNNQMVPHQVHFINMKFVDVSDRKMSFPADPIVFYKNINSEDDQTITCYVDRPGILRILEKPVDVNVKFETNDNVSEIIKTVERIKTMEMKRKQPFPCTILSNDSSVKLNEEYVTQFVTLLILFSNAYIALFKLMRSDFHQYYNFLLDHESLLKERSLPNINNLIIGKFNFRIEAGDKRKEGLVFK